jgi:hypothetical protein
VLALTLVVALSAPAMPPRPLWWSGRVYTSPELHVGIRGAAFVGAGEIACGVSVRVATRWF